MTKRLAGRVAVVTGGGTGIGREIVRKLSREGADVAVADVAAIEETRALVDECGQRFFGAFCDVSDEAQVNSFAAQVRAALGSVDIVVNNAAIARLIDFESTTLELWRRFFSVNVDGYFLVAKAFLEDLKRSRAGRIVNISSASYWESPPSFVAYISAKGAVNGFTHALATDLAKYDVTVNAVAPSIVRTPTTLRNLNEELFDEHIQLQNLRRQETPEDVANVVAFLVSDEAAFITGQIVAVDGGLTRR